MKTRFLSIYNNVKMQLSFSSGISSETPFIKWVARLVLGAKPREAEAGKIPPPNFGGRIEGYL